MRSDNSNDVTASIGISKNLSGQASEVMVHSMMYAIAMAPRDVVLRYSMTGTESDLGYLRTNEDGDYQVLATSGFETTFWLTVEPERARECIRRSLHEGGSGALRFESLRPTYVPW